MLEDLAWGLTGVREGLKLNRAHIALIVEGHSEEKALPKRINRSSCKISIRRRNINGRDVSIERIAKDVSSKLNALNSRGATLGLVIVDRENRASKSF